MSDYIQKSIPAHDRNAFDNYERQLIKVPPLESFRKPKQLFEKVFPKRLMLIISFAFYFIDKLIQVEVRDSRLGQEGR